jgi:hypothetical protein
MKNGYTREELESLGIDTSNVNDEEFKKITDDPIRFRHHIKRARARAAAGLVPTENTPLPTVYDRLAATGIDSNDPMLPALLAEIQDYSEEGDERGFRIKGNGNTEFYNILARGHIEALSGYFHGNIFANDGYFKGIIEAKTGLTGPWSSSPSMPSYIHVRAFGRFTINTLNISPVGVSGNYVGAEKLNNNTWLVKYNFTNVPQQQYYISPYLLAFTYGFWRLGTSFETGRVVRCIDTTPGDNGWKIHLMKEDGTIYTPQLNNDIAVMFFAIL